MHYINTYIFGDAYLFFNESWGFVLKNRVILECQLQGRVVINNEIVIQENMDLQTILMNELEIFNASMHFFMCVTIGWYVLTCRQPCLYLGSCKKLIVKEFKDSTQKDPP